MESHHGRLRSHARRTQYVLQARRPKESMVSRALLEHGLRALPHMKAHDNLQPPVEVLEPVGQSMEISALREIR
eukprot:8139148-Pyramimonas_sp.AAC.1